MRQIDMRAAAVKTLREEMGRSLVVFIDQWGDKADFAKEAGINRATLYRLLDGKNAGTDTLLRVLRTLERYDAIEILLKTAEETPIQKIGVKNSVKKTAAPNENPVFGELKLGRKKDNQK
jgi:predicted transcriptional regulator